MRLIDADALKNELSDKDYITYTHEYGDAIPVNWIMNAIDNAPTVVTKGHWIDEGQYAEGHSEHYYRCSECGGHIIELRTDDFCKHCGAYMREEAEHDDS